MDKVSPAEPQRYVLRFLALQPQGSSLGFPCNASGEVLLNSLSERVRNNYFLARHGVGRAFSQPRVEPMLKAAVPRLTSDGAVSSETYFDTRPRPTAFA